MTQGDSKQDIPGRKYDQPARGSNSAGSMGSDGTGDVGSLQGNDKGGRQSAGRTDDLLSGGSDADEQHEGFSRGRDQGDQGNRQSAGRAEPDAKLPPSK